MLARVDLRAATPDRATLHGLLPRAAVDVAAVVATVEPIVADVRDRGEAAIREATARFDGVELASIRVAEDELTVALAALDPDVRAALEVAIERVRMVHADQRRTDVTHPGGPGRVGHPAVGAGPAGRACTSRAAWPCTRPAS